MRHFLLVQITITSEYADPSNQNLPLIKIALQNIIFKFIDNQGKKAADNHVVNPIEEHVHCLIEIFVKAPPLV